MNDMTKDMQYIQQLVHEAYISSGTIMALLSMPEDKVRFNSALDNTVHKFEAAVVEVRNLCERNRPRTERRFRKTAVREMAVAGSLHVTEMGWVHLELSALLPPCRHEAPRYLTDTVTRLLDGYELEYGTLPQFDHAMLVIDEHCSALNRQIYDQDNKGWKAVINRLKGRLFEDDDQFTLHLALLSTDAEQVSCHIYVLPQRQADDFFYMRHAGLPMV